MFENWIYNKWYYLYTAVILIVIGILLWVFGDEIFG